MPGIVEFLLLAARVILASVFLLAGTAKFVDPVGSRKALRDFGLPPLLARPLVVLLPLLELAVAAILIPVSLAWYGAWGALGLLTAFLAAVGIAMLRGRKPDCHCFGQLHSAPVGWSTLVRNIALAACAAWLVARGPGRSGPALWAWLESLSSVETKLAAIAGCVLGFLFLRVLVGSRQKPEPVETSFSLPFFAEDEGEDEPDQAPAERAAPRPAPRPAPVEPSSSTPRPLDIGLPPGTPAPEFELPSINGDKRSLQSLRAGGRDVVLIFSSPHCKSCEALASNLVRWTRGVTGMPNVVVVSRGSAQENIAKLKGLEPSQVLLQREHEVAHAYDCSTTPTAVLVGADGLIKTQLIIGGPAIKQLLFSNRTREDANAARTKASQRASVFGG